jgi:Lrp/AsnC family transcriptional regulator for asnA, asnC and gidA
MNGHLDSLDREIIGQLQADGRRSNVDIARKAGVAEATVRKRLERLVKDGIIQIIALPNPEMVSLPVQAMIMLQVELLHSNEVAARLASMPEVRSLYRITGEHDLVADALFSSQDHLRRFLSETLSALPGVHRSSTSHVLTVLKPITQWRLPEPRGPQALLVDDDPDFVEITRVALQREGFEVTSASSGREALERARSSRPDVVIMDVMMEGVLDGLGTSGEFRADRRLRDVPVVIVTSITQSDCAAMFPTDGSFPFDAFLTKPVDPDRLISEVRRVIKPR